MVRSLVILTLVSVCIGGASADDGVVGNGFRVDHNGQLVSVDPQLRANLLAQLHASLQALGTPSTSGPVRIVDAGAQAMTLGADHTAFVVSRIDADDKLTTSCVHGAQAAATFLARARAQAAASSTVQTPGAK